MSRDFLSGPRSRAPPPRSQGAALGGPRHDRGGAERPLGEKGGRPARARRGKGGRQGRTLPSRTRPAAQIRVKCNEDDTVGDLKKMVAAQTGAASSHTAPSLRRPGPPPRAIPTACPAPGRALAGTRPEKIRIQKWYTVYKDHITLSDYEVGLLRSAAEPRPALPFSAASVGTALGAVVAPLSTLCGCCLRRFTMAWGETGPPGVLLDACAPVSRARVVRGQAARALHLTLAAQLCAGWSSTTVSGARLRQDGLQGQQQQQHVCSVCGAACGARHACSCRHAAPPPPSPPPCAD